MGLFWIIMLTLMGLLAIGWIIYGIYEYRWRKEEKENPKKPRTEQAQKARDSFEEYTKKMASFKRKDYDRKDFQ